MSRSSGSTTPPHGPRRGRLRRRRDAAGGRRSVRGAAELSVLAVVASLVTGVFFGSGISSTAVDLADGLTWIGDGPSGEVIQVNPATGRPQLRLQVAQPGDELALAQYDGRLFVTNRTTGELQSFDLSRVLRSAARRVTEGQVVDTLVRDGELYLVDRSQSTIARLDPESLDELGTIWTSEAGLADAVLDGGGRVWALEDDGVLHRLVWSDDAAAFEETDRRTVELSGPGSVLVAHDDAVTVFGPDQGVVVQVGTSPAIDADAPRLGGDLLAPQTSPSDLVPASAPQTGTVVLTTPQGVLEVDVAAIGCGNPGTPEVYEDVVYVPCLGDAKVIRLGADGTRAQPDIETPGSPDPELVVDDDHLIVNTPGADTGAVVGSGGDVTDLVRLDPAVPVTVPSTTADPPVAKAPSVVEAILGAGRPADEPQDGRDQGRDEDRRQPRTPRDPRATGAPTPGLPTQSPVPPPTGQPTGQPPGTPTGQPTGAPTGGPTGGVKPIAPATVPTGQPPGTPTRSPSSSPSGPGTATPTTGPSQPPTATDPSTPPQTAQPPADLTAPTAVTTTVVSSTQVRVSWVHPGAEQYVVSRAGGADLTTVPGGNRQASVTVTPGEATSFVVTAVSGGRRASSPPSTSVTTSDVPGAPPGVTVQQDYPSATSGRFRVAWQAADPHGAAVTSYRVVVTTSDGVDWTATVGGQQLDATLTKECPGGCQIQGRYGVSVTAVNSAGTGATSRAQGTAPAPPAEPLPAGGFQLVTGEETTSLGHEGVGTTTLTLAPPADWAAFTGQCAFEHTGNRANPTTESSAYDCDATTLDLAISTGVRREPSSGTTEHSITFFARNPSGEVATQTYSWTVTQPVLCQTCQIP